MGTVALRCDGDGRVGAGHVARCVQIARAFRAAGDEAVLVGGYAGTAAALVEAAGVPTWPPADARAGIPPDVDLAIVDSYEIEAADLTAAASAVTTVVLRDSGAAPPGTIGFDYHADSEAAVGGLDYTPVDPRYTTARRRRGFERALVSVGGGGTGDSLRRAAVEAIRAAGLTPDVPGSSGRAPAGLVDAVRAADVAIGAAGVSAYEMACAGLPAILVPVAPNQERVVATLSALGVAFAGGDLGALLQRIGNASVRERMALVGPAAIDGYGACRARDALRAVACGDPLPRVLRYRPATFADSARQLAWRNDPATRHGSRNGALVSAAEHDAWFAEVVAARDRLLLIVEGDGGAVGSVRFDLDGEAAEISVVVAPDRRGAGFATQAIREASELLLSAHPEVERVNAVVLAANTASARAFERAGFAAARGAGEDRRAFVLRRVHLASSAS